MRILVAVDFSDPSRAAVEEVARRPWPADTQVRLLNVVEPLDVPAFGGVYDAQFVGARTGAARSAIEGLAADLRKQGLAAETAVLTGYPKLTIEEEARRWGADFIFVGSRGLRGLTRFLLGSVAKSVVRGAPCSVEIVRGGRDAERRRVMKLLVATDGCEASAEAVRSVAARPWPAETQVIAVSVAPLLMPFAEAWSMPVEGLDRIEKEGRLAAQKAVAEAVKVLTEAGLRATPSACAGEPKEVLLDHCVEHGADLLVLGSHGRGGLDRFLLGSVSEALAVHAPCSVEVIRKRRD